MRAMTRVLTVGLATASLFAARPVFGQQAAATQGGSDTERDGAAQALRTEVDRLRQEFEEVKRQYGDRLAALEARLATIDAGRAGVVAPRQGAQQAAPEAAAQAAPPLASPPPAAAQASPEGQPSSASALSKVFNPDMAAIGDFLGAAGSNPVAPSPAFEMHEAELSFQAVVDPYARGDFFVTVGPGGSVALEEGFLTFTSLPGGLLAKVGQTHAAFGKVNQMHNHVMPWTDRPLVTENLVGGEDGITDAGISLSRLVPARGLFLEATAEFYSGNSAVFRAPTRGDLTYLGRLRGYRDLGESANIDVGGSIAYGHNGAATDSTTQLIGFDATFRYRPLRRALYRRFLARTEMVWSRRSELSGQPQSFGAYVSGEYQLSRRWFAGARFDYADRAQDPELTDEGGSLILTFWPSEFSQVRGQLRRTHYAEGTTANEFLFQFLFAIGAHGAHVF
jgi:hypothetical protein